MNFILDAIGDVIKQDSDTYVHVKRKTDGKVLKVADLVTDTKEREIIQNYLRTADSEDDIDIIIALGWLKKALIGLIANMLYRWLYGSLTEIIQIIGRATRAAITKHTLNLPILLRNQMQLMMR